MFRLSLDVKLEYNARADVKDHSVLICNFSSRYLVMFDVHIGLYLLDVTNLTLVLAVQTL